MIARVAKNLVLMAAVVLLAACARGTGDLEEWVAEVRDRPPEPIDPIEPIRPAEVVSYEADGLRDPFQIRAQREEEDEDPDEEVTDGLRPDPDRRREYLEGFTLDALEMVGTLEMEDTLYALIRDTENVVHRVTEGNYLGQNHGEILEVRPDRVVLLELVQDGRGDWMERRASVALAEQ
ncbi:pilus assembly protein PilP [Wenzhouxiangella sp. AB-CW3]|uniref:pilus assembly protein PilP n=1 Tax=Wenzhouxiangella sp. AB-CW3 TaxID=2771012 RepID=UPI00168BEBA1|nr:pilus assembly protein PilP [Wenzhouxiangella sp. AB-CW3]QOC21856.1 pilus assembly protein PilP [Wenzhouxiangella sp. AB-CW3]